MDYQLRGCKSDATQIQFPSDIDIRFSSQLRAERDAKFIVN